MENKYDELRATINHAQEFLAHAEEAVDFRAGDAAMFVGLGQLILNLHDRLAKLENATSQSMVIGTPYGY